MEKKELFKYFIKEFHERKLPEIYPRALEIPQTRKIVSLIGARRIGKTSYFFQMIGELEASVGRERILYINFEDERILPLDVKDLNSILEAYYELYPENAGRELYLFFDEVQNVPGWEVYVRRLYDRGDLKLFLTGSSSKMLSKELATSLRGRTLSFYLYPLDFREYLAFRGVEPVRDFEYSKQRFELKKLFEEYLYNGGFPEVVLEAPELRKKIVQDYFEMMIYRDLVERFSVRNTTLLKALTKYLITNIGNPFSVTSYYKAIKQDQEVSKGTLLEYLSHLEDISLVYFLPLFSYSLKSQSINPKKVYCLDNGLRNAVSFSFSKDEGRLAENLVFLELMRREKEVYYWKNGGEVDFVVKEEDNSLTAINVTYNDSIDEREVSALKKFSEEEEFASRINELILLTKDTEKTENGITYIPLWMWMLEK
ncbi:AAA family ATPase [Methanosarcina sp. DH2]|uniref:ATP-binding protein n=1 Tax=Methanosarcina sp. DH2 TaxID=2605639 RepID=UPI001E4648D3|nr:ATP-binding protein [Methanosarcina sp. DH2]MCC4770576.1 AAA family ATPase [Methanosarcina sp. DH2]